MLISRGQSITRQASPLHHICRVDIYAGKGVKEGGERGHRNGGQNEGGGEWGESE